MCASYLLVFGNEGVELRVVVLFPVLITGFVLETGAYGIFSDDRLSR